MWSSAYYIAARGGNEGTPRIPRESRESLNKSCGTPVGMQKKCRNEDAFYCNAATAVPLVAKKESASTSFESYSHEKMLFLDLAKPTL